VVGSRRGFRKFRGLEIVGMRRVEFKIKIKIKIKIGMTPRNWSMEVRETEPCQHDHHA